MASPQLENGYTRVANEILEQLFNRRLNGMQLRIILLLWRETYGFSRKEREFSDTYIASRLGIKRQNAHAEFKALENAGIVTIIRPPTYTEPRIAAFGKDYDRWEIGSCNESAVQARKSISGMRTDNIPVLQEHDTPVMKEQHTPALFKHSHRKQPYKKTNKDIGDCFENLWSLYPKKEGKGSVSETQKAKLYAIGYDEMARTVERYNAKIAAEDIERRFIKQGSTFFNSGYVDYLDANYAQSITQKLEVKPREFIPLSDIVEWPPESGEYRPKWEVPSDLSAEYALAD